MRAVALFLCAACGGGSGGGRDAGGTVTTSPGEDDWSLPAWVQPSANAGFFNEDAAPDLHVDTRVLDFTWRQLEPEKGVFSTTTGDDVYDLHFASFDEQLAGEGPFWLRIWISGADWAPAWVQEECGLTPVGPGYMDDPQLPLWNACFWGYARDLYRRALVDHGLAADPRVRFIYVPGAFTWCEFDFDIIDLAVEQGNLDFATFDAWWRQAMDDLVEIAGADAHKLVYTGEDYPFGPFDAADDLYARGAVERGMGIRTGITELFNFHLSHVPAYGTTIAPDGHMVTDEGWVLFEGGRVAATENECYTDCGFVTDDVYYAVKMSNLKALQLRMNWIYALPTLGDYPEHWEWVRLELGKTAADAPDAWVALREAEDLYWVEDTSVTWDGAPWVKNFERWIVQREVAPDGLTRRGEEVRTGVLDPTNGTAVEGRRTDHAAGSDFIYLDVDDRFLSGAPVPVDVKVTYRDRGSTPFFIEYASAAGMARSPELARTGDGAWKTATVTLTDATFDGTLPGATDLRLAAGGVEDLEVRFVRIVKRDAP